MPHSFAGLEGFGLGLLLREALHALCVRASAPTRKTISATVGVLAHISSVVLLEGLRRGSSNRGRVFRIVLQPSMGVVWLIEQCGQGLFGRVRFGVDL